MMKVNFCVEFLEIIARNYELSRTYVLLISWGPIGMINHFRFIFSALSAALALAACGVVHTQETVSQTQTVDLPQTQVKWQSIGNCWSYAVMGWAESIVLRETGKELNFSESFMTYTHFRDQLLSGVEQVETGGSWNHARNLIARYGMMHEADFIPTESEETFSKVQKAALEAINLSLKEGVLSRDKSIKIVDLELQKAFNLTLTAEMKKKIFPASAIKLNGRETLNTKLNSWADRMWPASWGAAPDEKTELPQTFTLNTSQKLMLSQVKKALNKHEPVVMSWFVDFNAMNNEGIFNKNSLDLLKEGHQGYHMTVIEDYLVEGIHPVTGQPFSIGEGEATAEEKLLAEQHGNVVAFIVKNSWGGAERLDRSSYNRFGQKGYHRLDASYLFSWLAELSNAEEKSFVRTTTAITSFALPQAIR